MDTYPVHLNDHSIGTLQLTREGNWVRAELRCKRAEQGILRGFLLCRQGELPLGVLAPEGGELRLCRRIPVREIEGRQGVTGAEVRLSYTFRDNWQHADGSFFHKGELAGAVKNWEGAMWRSEGEKRLLALPFDPSRPFPLVTLFCFARIMPVNRRRCAVFCFDREEQPVMPEKCP